jgi:hypothetical protein
MYGGDPPYTITSANSLVAALTSQSSNRFALTLLKAGATPVIVSDSRGQTQVLTATSVPSTVLPITLNVPSAVNLPLGSSRTVSISGGVTPYVVGSSNESIVTASVSGSLLTLTPLASGLANLAITDASGNSISLSVTVGAAVDLFTTAPSSLSLGQGVSQTFTILGGRSPYYVASGNPVTVSASVAGSTLTVTGGASGSGTIAIRDSLGSTVTIAVTVGNQTPLYSSAPATVVMAAGVQRTFIVDGGTPAYISGAPAYQVVSSDPGVAAATLSGNSLVVASVASGTSQIVVTDSLGSRITFQVTVGGAVDLHTTAPSAVTLSPGSASAQTYEIRGGAAPYTVTSGSTSVATAVVSGNLLTITGLNSGTASVQVTDRLGATVSVTVTVNVSSTAASPLTVTPLSATGAVGDVIRFEVRGGTPVYTATVANQNVASAAAFGSASAFTVQLTSVGSSNVAVIDASGQVQNVTVTAQSSLATPLFTSAPTQVSMALGAPSTFTVGGGTGTYTFSSSDVSVVTVPGASSTQLVLTPVAIGTATVSVTDTVGTKVTFDVLVGGVQPLRLSAGASVTVGLSAGPVTYSILGGRMNYTAVSTNKSVVDVNPPGATASLVISPVGAGTANIVVTDSAGTQVTLAVTVAQSGVQALSVTPASASANVGDDLVFTVVGGTAPYTFTVNNNSVATRTSASPGPSPGVFRMVGAGTTNVTVADAAGQVQEVTITVTQAATQLRLSPTTLILPETYQLGTQDTANNLLLSIYGGSTSTTFTPYSSDPTRVSVKVVNLNQIQLSGGTSQTLCSNADVTRYALSNVAVNDPSQPAAANVFDILITVVDQTGASATAKLVILDDGADLSPNTTCR